MQKQTTNSKKSRYVQKPKMQVPALPILKKKDEILKLISSQSILIISGLTGSGKSTQTPQYILDAFPNKRIAVCQPRRLAATSLAERVCSERKQRLGIQIGYHIGMDSKQSPSTRLTYMTYGIMIEQLLHSYESMKYDFVILDEIHERTLEMDFILVLLKKFINRQKEERLPMQKQLRLIIMSATLNNQTFRQYFAKKKNSSIILQPTDFIKQKANHRRYSTKVQNIQVSEQQKAPLVQIDQQRNHYIYQVYIENIMGLGLLQKQQEQKILDDIEILGQKYSTYSRQRNCQISNEMYEMGCNLIFSIYQRNEIYDISEDILVFLPGLMEIEKMKRMLIELKPKNQQNQDFLNRIIEVHSAFSEDLGRRIFNPNIQKKIFLSTNMGESSITLPNCNIVIDYCLSRKVEIDQQNMISKLKTVMASKSNLIQRKGRVGRVADGYVYRMIFDFQYEKLQDFEQPEIQCVNLEKAILKVKQLQKNSKVKLFKDIEDVFCNVMDPPQMDSVHRAIEILVQEKALIHIGDKINQRNFRWSPKLGTQILKISQLGIFMSEMDCDIKLSKLIMMGIKLNIPEIAINIAAILSSTKSFFLNKNRVKNKELFYRNQTSYNYNCDNDYLLKSHIFEHWKALFFKPTIIPQNIDDNPQSSSMSRPSQLNPNLSKNVSTKKPKYQIKSKPQQTQSKVKKPKYVQKKTNSVEAQKEKIIEQKLIQNKNQQLDSTRQLQKYSEQKVRRQKKMINKFVSAKRSGTEKTFCAQRGVGLSTMRQILKLHYSLKQKVIKYGMMVANMGKNAHVDAQVDAAKNNVLIIICIMHAFPDLNCPVNFALTSWGRGSNCLDLAENEFMIKFYYFKQKISQKDIEKYAYPEVIRFGEKNPNWVEVKGSSDAIKKFILPQPYKFNDSEAYLTKEEKKIYSKVFKLCYSNRNAVQMQFSPTIKYQNRTVIVNGQSINRQITSPARQQQNALRTKQIVEPKQKHFITHSFTLSNTEKSYTLKQCILAKNEAFLLGSLINNSIIFKLHKSNEFVSTVIIRDNLISHHYLVPFFLRKKQLQILKKLSKNTLLKEKQHTETQFFQELLSTQDVNHLIDVIYNASNKIPQEQIFEYMFIKEQHAPTEIITGNNQDYEFLQHVKDPQIKFHQRYNKWKQELLQRQNVEQMKFIAQSQEILICAQCFSEGILQKVADIDDYNFVIRRLNLSYCGVHLTKQAVAVNAYKKAAYSKVKCKRNHIISTQINLEDQCVIEKDKVLLYLPFKKKISIDELSEKADLREFIEMNNQSKINELKKVRSEIKKYQCKFCAFEESFDEKKVGQPDKEMLYQSRWLQQKLLSTRTLYNQSFTFEKPIQQTQEQILDKKWKKVSTHINSQSHIIRYQEFQKCLRLVNGPK